MSITHSEGSLCGGSERIRYRMIKPTKELAEKVEGLLVKINRDFEIPAPEVVYSDVFNGLATQAVLLWQTAKGDIFYEASVFVRAGYVNHWTFRRMVTQPYALPLFVKTVVSDNLPTEVSMYLCSHGEPRCSLVSLAGYGGALCHAKAKAVDA